MNYLDADKIKSLLQGYHARVPRYTSYPTAVEFKEGAHTEQWFASLEQEIVRGNTETSLYVHVPYCPVMCFFCACSKEVTKDRSVVRPYLDAIKKELSAYRPWGSQLEITQLHWGGGSPNFLQPAEMQELYDAIREVFPRWKPHAECSVELDPRETNLEQLDTLLRNGFNRFSFGVQDLNPEVQRIIHRKQSKEQTRTLLDYVRRHDAYGTNMDLIYGLPGQSVLGWGATMNEIVDMRPDRLALYGYAHVAWKSVAQKSFEKKSHLPTPSERVDMFVASHQLLVDKGYYYIGLDHFSLEDDLLSVAHKQGTMRRNFMGYTTGAGSHVLGFGPSAISSIPRAYAQNVISIEGYKQGIAQAGTAINKALFLTSEDLERRYLIESVMCTGKISYVAYAEQFGRSFHEQYPQCASELAMLERDGIIMRSPQGFEVTLLGRLFLRSVASVFDQYLSQHRASGEKVFSQAV